MAKAISRNLHIRYLYNSICSRKPSFHLLHNVSNAPTTTKSLPLSPLAIRLDRLENGFICYRFLCTSSSSNQSNSGSGGSSAGANSGSGGSSAGANSGYSESSGGSQKTEQGKSIRGSPVSWMSFFLLVCTGAGLVFYYDREKKRHIEDITNASNSVKQGPSVGKAAIGGPFSLIDHNGKPVTEKDFFGKWTVVYFGFTHCPDICPDELQKLAAAVDKIKETSGIQIVPIFISVDPERDTVEQVGEYVKEFHPNLIGLTGSPEEIKKTARAYRVYYMKTEEEGSDYLVDHSIVMYLMDPKMEFVKFFGKNNDVDMLADGIIKEIKQYKKVKA
ncbi:protein SCO1 homolog 1, mitochondrial [Solanum dulcamara]|uniref:protein SCO1 homolog 1, mitochondrial n=1 Tax=Solanum dulcamara TaxID=45834 RepID=UPI002486AF45|nr:protein SCO1 homolog 1, mitochondrial [Solanum dulcamara]